MLTSMTGFGNDLVVNENFTLETEIKSLNSRYLDLSVRLPKELSQHEFELRELVKSKLLRGKVTVSVNLSYNNGIEEKYALNESELKKIVTLLNQIRVSNNIETELSLDQILLFRENYLVQSEEETEFDLEILKNSVSRALINLTEMRVKEGNQLEIDFQKRIEIIEKSLIEIENTAQNSVDEYFNKFKEKAKKLAEEFVDDENRFLAELGILSEKHDVTEECTRLRSHIKLFKETLSNPNDVGRKLNFICQEMNREVNTINSKSISSGISHLGISIKEELEKIREQVQNIE